MNALAIDCAVSRLSIAAKKDTHIVKVTLDVGMKQSEKLLPTIDYVLKEAELTAKELDYTAITIGPGSFTGLRLGLSALKSLELANKTPIYGIPSFDAYAFPYRTAIETVLSVIDGNRDQFYASFYCRGEKLSGPDDKPMTDIIKQIDPETEVLVCGPDAKTFVDEMNEQTPLYSIHCFTPSGDCTESLFTLAENMIAQKKPALAEYEGPVYVRKSEAEIVHEEQVQGKK
jgi:tRNA threonylcarbamoyladenosine biosynthesis protein TsaB